MRREYFYSLPLKGGGREWIKTYTYDAFNCYYSY